jgi:hypothetical protein
MTTTAVGTVESKNWEQHLYAPVDGAPDLVHASGVDQLRGDIDAEATWQGTAMTRADGSGITVAMQRVVGSIGGRSGNFVLQLEIVTDVDGSSAGTWTVVAGSATGGLRGMRGKGTVSYLPASQQWSYTLDYDVA